jgi:hypothetical protein
MSDEYHLEVLGQCMTNPKEGSKHDATVEFKHLWSFAQEEALVAVSEQQANKCWKLITDPERRAKRIAAHYADLYFKSAEKSQGNLQIYWPALAAFVVKDIVEAYRYAREEVLSGGWRNWKLSQIGSEVLTGASPYEHAERVYAALAKGNIWLFMDIYPWLWFMTEYGIDPKTGKTIDSRLMGAAAARDWNTFQAQSKQAVEELPYGPHWLNRLKGRIDSDPVYKEAHSYFTTTPVWNADPSGGMGGAYADHEGKAYAAHSYVKKNVASYDNGYRVPPSKYWGKFSEAFYVMEEERIELKRIIADSGATARLTKIRDFKVTNEMLETYRIFTKEASVMGDVAKFAQQKLELVAIAKQEQLNVLQPLIYEDMKLKASMDANHAMSRRWGSWLSPKYAVVYSAAPKTDNPKLKTVFDEPKNPWDQIKGSNKSLPNPADRMKYVDDIAKDFNDLMDPKNGEKPYMEAELQKIRGWINA